jgi:hypothetical protein
VVCYLNYTLFWKDLVCEFNEESVIISEEFFLFSGHWLVFDDLVFLIFLVFEELM